MLAGQNGFFNIFHLVAAHSSLAISYCKVEVISFRSACFKYVFLQANMGFCTCLLLNHHYHLHTATWRSYHIVLHGLNILLPVTPIELEVPRYVKKHIHSIATTLAQTVTTSCTINSIEAKFGGVNGATCAAAKECHHRIKLTK